MSELKRSIEGFWWNPSEPEKNIELKPECINVLLYKGIRMLIFRYILNMKDISIPREPI